MITINWKNYLADNEAYSYFLGLINTGHLEEVKENKEPQFTPWQEIEVSDDWDKWYTSVFEKKEFDGFRCKHDWLWLFARPIEDKIELLPAYEPSEPDWRDTQISLLTRTVNKLINK